MKKYKELEKSARGPLDPLKIILERMSLNRARKKCPGTSNKKYSGRYCTVLYCTAVLYKYHAMGRSQFYNIERYLMAGMESQICGSTEIAWDTPYTGDILSPGTILLVVSTGETYYHRSGPGQIENDAGSSDFHEFEQLSRIEPGAVWATASTSPSTSKAAAKSTSGTIWTVQDMSKNLIVTCARILRTGGKLIL